MKEYSSVHSVWLLRVPSAAQVTLSILRKRGQHLRTHRAARAAGSGTPHRGVWWDSGCRPSSTVSCSGPACSPMPVAAVRCQEAARQAGGAGRRASWQPRGTHQLPVDKSFHSRASRAGRSPARGFPAPLQPCNCCVLAGTRQCFGCHWDPARRPPSQAVGGLVSCPPPEPRHPPRLPPTAPVPAAPPHRAHVQSRGRRRWRPRPRPFHQG